MCPIPVAGCLSSWRRSSAWPASTFMCTATPCQRLTDSQFYPFLTKLPLFLEGITVNQISLSDLLLHNGCTSKEQLHPGQSESVHLPYEHPGNALLALSHLIYSFTWNLISMYDLLLPAGEQLHPGQTEPAFCILLTYRLIYYNSKLYEIRSNTKSKFRLFA